MVRRGPFMERTGTAWVKVKTVGSRREDMTSSIPAILTRSCCPCLALVCQ
ncbi:hypothetical protein KP509_35G021100 [Ceratopteris richardii]|uniref:Uncharacterized protein n=1 Tax=Ceratopteris richardii TaxID=49495 RepID=A0A8T2QEF5_CERRI|nr:hypothetical protein KP509_35G021100 [Ceratopteris richardii]